jgi:4a-hydroxytetrahydrobiopterin dehydratase
VTVSLRDRHCVPCDARTPALTAAQQQLLGPEVPLWTVQDGKLRRTLTLPSFRAVMSLLSQVADLAEAEGHHPDFCVSYRRVDLALWTHAINGLSENDYVLAARIDALAGG